VTDGGSLVVGVDIGGTFTDAVAIGPDGDVTTGKCSTTPDDLSVGFFSAVRELLEPLGLRETELYGRMTGLAHGTTAGINALVTRTGARTALVATSGHGDTLRIMRGSGRTLGASVEEMLDFSRSTRPDPLVARADVFEIAERVDSGGKVVVALTDDALDEVVDRIERGDYEAVAISLLWSFVNPTHEQLVQRAMASRLPHVFVSASHDVAPRVGEYGRTVASVMNAMIGPLMTSYVDRIVAGARARGYAGEVLFGHVEGGLVPAGEAKRFPLGTVQSGPVAGVVGSARYGRARGEHDLVVTDMGGTTLDVSVVVGGEPSYEEEAVIERQLAYLRKVEVESIGAGGGSIAWIDPDTGGLRVGPQSAGAYPGPVCYGRGGADVTVTDADLVLGILSPDRPLAGGLMLDLDAATKAVEALGDRLGLGIDECAAGVVEIIDTKMEDLVRRATLHRGHDARGFTLWAFGGAGGAHAGLYARGLGVDRIVFPLADTASVWSALGCVLLEQRRTFQLPLYLREPFDLARVRDTVAALEASARAYAAATFARPDAAVLDYFADMKFALQVYEVETRLESGAVGDTWAEDAIDRFEAVYSELYGEGTSYRAAGVVLTALRVTVREPGTDRTRFVAPHAEGTGVAPASRAVYWRELGERRPTPIHDGPTLTPGAAISGPAVIEFPNTVIAVRPQQRAVVDADGSLTVRFQEG
jgi:N-methylhydantoinase A